MPGFVDCWNLLASKGNKEPGGTPVLSDADRGFLEQRIQEQVRAGYSPIEAAKMAVQKHLGETIDQHRSIYEQAGVKLPEPPKPASVEPPPPVSPVEAPPAAPEPTSLTAIKNATVDTERAARGLPPAMAAIERDFPEVRDQLLKKLDSEPTYQDNLIQELKTKPRALTDLEDAALLHRQVDLQNQFSKTASDLIAANESGDLGTAEELNIRSAALSDKLLELYDVGKSSGTETGRGLNARKMLAAEDFSLGNMITQKRAAVKGRQLTPEQMAEVGKAHKEITARQIAYDAYETTPRAEAYRRRLRNLAEEYRQRTAKGDFAPRPRKQILLDPEGMKLKADLERAKIDFKRGLAKDRLQNRTWWEKALDGIAKWRRTFILSWPTVLGKLTTASGELIGITPAEELVRKGVTKVLPSKITEKSLRFGKGSSLHTEVGAIVHTWKELFKAVPQRFKTGNADIDLLYGRPDIVPPELKDFVGNLHSALKEPARQNEFFRAQQQILQRYAERGVDISDPIIQTKAGFEAYRHANAQIFIEDNRLANGINAFIGRLGDVNKLTQKPSMMGKAAQTAARYEFPIVRIPLNIIKRTFEYSFGLPTGAARVVRGMIQGLDGMPVVEADAIIKNLSRGALGASAIAYGYFNPQQFGGYYQKGEKRAPGDLKAGHARVLGRDLPPWAVHNPLLAQFQIGSTIRRIVDSKLRKKDVSGPSQRQAIVAAYSGVIEDAPLVRQTEDSLKALDIRQQNQFFGEHLKSLVPGAVEWSAKYFDKDANGNPVVRKPEDVLDYVKAAVPGLRQQVPEKAEPRRGKSPF